MGTVRSTYLIDEEGIVRRAVTKVKAADDPQTELDALDGLAASDTPATPSE